MFMRIIHLSESKPAKLHAVADVYFRLYLPSPIGFRALTTPFAAARLVCLTG